jgi:hypothetical protein
MLVLATICLSTYFLLFMLGILTRKNENGIEAFAGMLGFFLLAIPLSFLLLTLF